jgi:hypothetical protein
MTDELKPKRKTGKELLDYPPDRFDELTNEELERRTAILKAQQAEADLQDVKDRLDDRKTKRTTREESFKSRGRELTSTKRSQEKHQSQCSHRKGGRGLEALQKGGTASDFAVIKHLMPWNEWYLRCQRCGKTWKPPHKDDYQMDTPEGKEAFEATLKEYREAMAFPSDNSPSSGITFQWDDGGKFVHENVKEVNLR